MRRSERKDYGSSFAQRIEELRRAYPVTSDEVINYLRGNFKKQLGQAIKRTSQKGMEQGMLIAYSSDRKFHTVWDKEVSENFTSGDWYIVERNRWLPIGWIQLHPISNFIAQFMEYVPSESDLLHINTDTAAVSWINGESPRVGMFGGLIIPGGRPIGWAWEAISLSETQVNRIYVDWDNSRSGIRYHHGGKFVTRSYTYQDIEDLYLDLRNNGVTINKKELGNDIAGSFASLVQDLSIKFGFL